MAQIARSWSGRSRGENGLEMVAAAPSNFSSSRSGCEARAVMNTAAEREATLIVLGLTGKNVFARLLAGNVPVELIKNTKIPVILFPPDWTGEL